MVGVLRALRPPSQLAFWHLPQKSPRVSHLLLLPSASLTRFHACKHASWVQRRLPRRSRHACRPNPLGPATLLQAWPEASQRRQGRV